MRSQLFITTNLFDLSMISTLTHLDKMIQSHLKYHLDFSFNYSLLETFYPIHRFILNHSKPFRSFRHLNHLLTWILLNEVHQLMDHQRVLIKMDYDVFLNNFHQLIKEYFNEMVYFLHLKVKRDCNQMALIHFS